MAGCLLLVGLLPLHTAPAPPGLTGPYPPGEWVHGLATLTDAEAREIAGRRTLFRVVLDGKPDGTRRAAGGTPAGGGHAAADAVAPRRRRPGCLRGVPGQRVAGGRGHTAARRPPRGDRGGRKQAAGAGRVPADRGPGSGPAGTLTPLE
jgi:hypothetical protein